MKKAITTLAYIFVLPTVIVVAIIKTVFRSFKKRMIKAGFIVDKNDLIHPTK